MELKTLFEFPGILITIGVLLLIVAIIIGLVAYRKTEKEDLTFVIKEEEDLKIPNEVPIAEAIPVEPEEEIQEEKNNKEENDYVELKEAIEKPKLAEVKEKKEERKIYGGANPVKDFGFKYEQEKKEEDIELL